MLSEEARALASFSLKESDDERAKAAYDELALELTAAVLQQDMSPHEALELVFRAHVGSEDARAPHREKLQAALQEAIKKDVCGDVSPEEYEVRKQVFLEKTGEFARNDFWVHRDKGVLRPGDKIMAVGAYIDYPRFTTHGCLNVAIDIESNVYGSGGHGRAVDVGSTIVASPVSGFVEKNGMPENYECGDTFWVNNNGLVIPENSILITTSSEAPPADLTERELWLPAAITDETIENGVASRIFEQIQGSAVYRELDDDQKIELANKMQRIFNEADRTTIAESLIGSSISEKLNVLVDEYARDQGLSTLEASGQLRTRLDSVVSLLRFDGKEFYSLGVYERVAAELAFFELVNQHKIINDNRNIGANEIFIPREISSVDEGTVEATMQSICASPVIAAWSEEEKTAFVNSGRDTLHGLENDPTFSSEARRKASNSLNSHISQELEARIREQNPAIEDFQLRSELSRLRGELLERVKQLEFSSIENNPHGYVEAAALAALLHTSSDEEAKNIYVSISDAEIEAAKGVLRAEKLRAFVISQVVDEQELTVRMLAHVEAAKLAVLPPRRAEHLQVWLTNFFISTKRNKPVPVLESYGRGYDWDIPGQNEERQEIAQIAEASGLRVSRHDGDIAVETGIFEEMRDIRRGIGRDPREVSYERLLRILRNAPLGLAFKYIRSGIVSLDQSMTRKVPDSGLAGGIH